MDYKPQLITFIQTLYEKATRFNMNTKFVYKRIHGALTAHDHPINSIQDLQAIKSIGPKTLKLFETHIFKHKEPDPITSTTLNPPKLVKDKKVRNHNYIPAFRSASYAILKVLNEEDGIPKDLICNRGKQHTTSNFNYKDRHSAWNSMKGLLKKKLIFEDAKKYYLTDAGHNICEKLFDSDSTIINEVDIPVKLLIDAREMKSRQDRLFFQTIFNEMGILNETKCLLMGDFAWTAGEYFLDYVVERKCGSDLCCSLVDGRLHEQKKRMMDCSIGRIFYIVENLRECDMERVGKAFVISALLSLKCNKITVIETDDIKETCKVIQNIDCLVRFRYKKCGNQSNNMRIDEYVEKGRKKKVNTVKDIFRQFLLSVYGINQNYADILANKYGSLKNFIETCNRNGIEKEFMDTSIHENVKFGKKVIQSIKELILGGDCKNYNT